MYESNLSVASFIRFGSTSTYQQFSMPRAIAKMSLKKVTMVVVVVVVLGASPSFESSAPVEVSSDHAVKNEETSDTGNAGTREDFENTTLDYEDFDEVQEERSSSQTPSTDTVMKYFKGIASLLALAYKFGGSFEKSKHEKVSKFKNEPRNEVAGKRFGEAQDRFEFPQKKFRYQDASNLNAIDQQFQPVENYPPYNPLAANTADTYDDKKTSYDADMSQYDSSKNSVADYVEIQQSHSYDFPLETPRPANHPNPGDWTHQIRPVYRPWTTGTPSKEVPGDSYHSWTSKPSGAKPETAGGDLEPESKPWKDEHPTDDFPIYHHDFHGPPPDDHHVDHHSADEDRVSKKPYSYYFLGRKLWYVPLLFSVYFIIYIGALVLKSVARHKIQFPDKIWNLHEDQFGHGNHRRHRTLDRATQNYEKALENIKNKFM